MSTTASPEMDNENYDPRAKIIYGKLPIDAELRRFSDLLTKIS